jgi:BASS family bile acid:Na+ symporter
MDLHMALMSTQTRPMRALAWLGRQGTRAIAALVFIGIAAPPIGALLKPFVTAAIFGLLTIAFVRVDAAALRGYVRRPALALAATGWTVLVIPTALGAAGVVAHLDARAPELFLGLMLQAVASPMMAAPSFAALIGLDATLVLVTLIFASACTPITAPVFSHAFVGASLELSPLTLGVRLFALIVGSAVAGLGIRRFAGAESIQRRTDEIDGLNIVVAFVFVAAVMEHVAARAVERPLTMLGLAAGAVGIFVAVFGMTALVFAWAGRDRAFAVGFVTSQRNMGLMLAATGGALPDGTWLYFAAAQLPIYLSPLLLRSLAGRTATRS